MVPALLSISASGGYWGPFSYPQPPDWRAEAITDDSLLYVSASYSNSGASIHWHSKRTWRQNGNYGEENVYDWGTQGSVGYPFDAIEFEYTYGYVKIEDTMQSSCYSYANGTWVP
jgi:hypothetical protein